MTSIDSIEGKHKKLETLEDLLEPLYKSMDWMSRNPYWKEIGKICVEKGKPRETDLNLKFRLWHRAKCSDYSVLCDMDAHPNLFLKRTSVQNPIITVLELKYEGRDSLTQTETFFRDSFLKNGFNFCEIYVTRKWNDNKVEFRVKLHEKYECPPDERVMSENELIEFMNGLSSKRRPRGQ